MRIRAVVVAGSILVSTACGDDSDGATGRPGALTVFAAASLTDAFEDLGATFERHHAGVDVTFSFAGSSSLREQVLAGAPADVFAPADPSNMDAIIASGAAGDAVVFAANHLQIVVPAGNPGGISSLADFANGGLFLGLCAPSVPCGTFARQALSSADVDPSLDTEEPDVRSLLTKIEAGDLDGGIVYHSDVVAAGDDIEAIEIPAEHDRSARYPIAVLAASDQTDLAAAFVAFVLSPAGQEVLAAHGFTAP